MQVIRLMFMFLHCFSLDLITGLFTVMYCNVIISVISVQREQHDLVRSDASKELLKELSP